MSETPMSSLAQRVAPAIPAVELDAIDIQLLRELSKDARIPQRKLGEILGMSSPAVSDRMARLKARGVIKGYSVDINWEALGFSIVAYLSVVASVGHEQNEVMERILHVRGVEEISVVTGGTDLLVRVRARGFDDLRAILARDIWSIEGLQRTETSISMIQVEPDNKAQMMLDTL